MSISKTAPSLLCAPSSTGFSIMKTSRLAALDIGSGSMKLTIADVDHISNRVINIVLRTELRVPFQRSFDSNGGKELNQSVLQQGTEAFRSFTEICSKHQVKAICGVATEVFRRAQNGQTFLNTIQKQFPISLRIISQEDEGCLSLASAIVCSKTEGRNIIAWDVGAGSFQMTAKEGNTQWVYGSVLGYVSALKLLTAKIRGNVLEVIDTPNPVSLEECNQLIQMIIENLEPPDDRLVKKIVNQNVLVCGIGTNKTALFTYASKIIGKQRFTLKEIWKAITDNVGKVDSDFSDKFAFPDRVLVSLSLNYAIMKSLSIESILFTPTNGTTEGLLISPQYWPKLEEIGEIKFPSKFLGWVAKL